MRLPLNPLKGTYKEFTSDVYSKKADNENCCLLTTGDLLFKFIFFYHKDATGQVCCCPFLVFMEFGISGKYLLIV